MFKQLPGDNEQKIAITIDGRLVHIPKGITAAAAALGSGLHVTRSTPVSGAKRAPFCMMGVCFECLMVIDGKANQRACCTYVKAGMSIETQNGLGPVIETPR